jgi:4-hydroxy-3-methylbut-2-enyl diphosphate reductase
VVIAGDPDHPEVAGLVGYAKGPAYVVRSVEEVNALPELGHVLLVAQTTQDEEKYNAIRTRFLERFPQAQALDTICSSTRRRQAEVRRMVGETDAVIVIGGRNSANTRRLHAISQEAGVRAYHVESAAELPLEELRSLATVGVTAGASTPEWIVREVVEVLQKL